MKTNIDKEKNEYKINLEFKDNELTKLKSENENLISEINKYKNNINNNEENLKNKIIEQKKIIKENENNIQNLSKENKEIKGKLLILQNQNLYISKES